MNAELIKAIRCYLNCQCCEHDLCDYILEDGYCNIDKILSDAADALEADEKRIAELEKRTKLPDRQEFLAKGSFIEEPLSRPKEGARMRGEHDEQ